MTACCVKHRQEQTRIDKNSNSQETSSRSLVIYDKNKSFGLALILNLPLTMESDHKRSIATEILHPLPPPPPLPLFVYSPAHSASTHFEYRNQSVSPFVSPSVCAELITVRWLPQPQSRYFKFLLIDSIFSKQTFRAPARDSKKHRQEYHPSRRAQLEKQSNTAITGGKLHRMVFCYSSLSILPSLSKRLRVKCFPPLLGWIPTIPPQMVATGLQCDLC